VELPLVVAAELEVVTAPVGVPGAAQTLFTHTWFEPVGQSLLALHDAPVS
jgi:hypothetical protein